MENLIELSEELAYEAIKNSPLYESFNPLCLSNAEVDALKETLAPILLAKVQELVNERIALMEKSMVILEAA